MSYIIAEHQSATKENGASHKKVIIIFAKIVDSIQSVCILLTLPKHSYLKIKN